MADGIAIFESQRFAQDGRLFLAHQHPFPISIKASESWTDNPTYQKHAVSCSEFQANMLGLRLSVNLSRGRTFRQIEKRLNAAEGIETGIVTKK